MSALVTLFFVYFRGRLITDISVFLLTMTCNLRQCTTIFAYQTVWPIKGTVHAGKCYTILTTEKRRFYIKAYTTLNISNARLSLTFTELNIV